MSSDEPVYAQCSICQKIFRLEALRTINVAGAQMRVKVCKHCIDAADERSGIEK